MSKMQEFDVTIKLRVVLLGGGEVPVEYVGNDASNAAHLVCQRMHEGSHYGRAISVESVETVERHSVR